MFSSEQTPAVSVYPDSDKISIWPGNDVDELSFRRGTAVPWREAEGRPGVVGPTPSVEDVRRVAAIPNPVVRNLEITYCYSRLSAALAASADDGANWCTYATWASRQAGRTIRGEDFIEHLELKLGTGRWVLHPMATAWRRLLRRGLFQPDTRIGHLTGELHAPFDAFERASECVARGNLKVFEEIGLEFARYLHACPPDEPPDPARFEEFIDALRPGDPPDGQRYLRQAFGRYELRRLERDPKSRAELALCANLEIGLHEQTRLQPEIRTALDAASDTKEEAWDDARSSRCSPSTARWWSAARRPAAAVSGIFAASAQRAANRLAREVITDSFMVLSLPGRVLALGTHLPTRTRTRSASPPTPTSASCSRGSSPSRLRRTTAARASGPSSTSGCTTSLTCFGRSTCVRSSRTSRSRPRRWPPSAVARCPKATCDLGLSEAPRTKRERAPVGAPSGSVLGDRAQSQALPNLAVVVVVQQTPRSRAPGSSAPSTAPTKAYTSRRTSSPTRALRRPAVWSKRQRARSASRPCTGARG